MGWRPDLRQFAQSPKSTVVGLCVLALAAERGVQFDTAGHLAMSARDWFDVACGVLTAVVSGLSRDAGRGNICVVTPSGDAMTCNEVEQSEALPAGSAAVRTKLKEI